MRIRLLGPLSLTGPDGDAVDLKGERLRTLLVALALTDGRPVSVRALTETLWPDEPPANPANAVQALASRLRAALGRDAVELTPAGYRLGLDTDVAQFSLLLRAGEHRRALALWRGEPDLPGHPDEVLRLRSLWRSAQDEVVDADLAEGNGEPHIPALRAAVAAEPLRERPRAQLLRALHQAGRDAEALAEYEQARTVLAEQLGADPSPLLRDAHLAVLAGPFAAGSPAAPSPSGQPPTAQPPSGLSPSAQRLSAEPGARHALPAALTSFLGRDAEVAAVRADLAVSRLVTLIGPGGAGKTRLAVESARSHPTPLRLVELAPVKDPADLAGTVAATLHWRETVPSRTHPGGNPADVTERLINVIGATELLLILDNCEHLIDAAAALAARLLAACPHLRILATSREPLAITGERLRPVPPLALPERTSLDGAARDDVRPARASHDYPAVRLFLDRALAVRPGWTPTDAELATVVTVCRALDGQPLAIELAAARMRSLDPQGIADRLTQRFRLLTGGSRDALPRHRTLRAVVDWSWDLLEAPERALLARLSVFSGPAALDAVERICHTAQLTEDQVFDVLASLVDKSLVVRSDSGRYRLLETIRVYAAERLEEEGAATATRDAHAAHHLALAERNEPELYGPGQIAVLAAFNAAHDDLIAALRWSVERRDADTANRLVAALGWYLWRRGDQGEHLPLVHQALELPAADVAPLPRAIASGITALYALDTDWMLASSLEMLHQATALRDALPAPAVHPLLPLLDIMTALFEQEDWTVTGMARGLLDAPHPWVRATGRLFFGFALQNDGRAEEAEAALRAASEQFREVGDLWGRSFCCSGLADYALWRGEVDSAVALWQQAIEFEQRMGVNADAPDYRARMIAARYSDAESAEAVAALERLVVAVRANGAWSPLLVTHSALASAYRRTGTPERGLPLLEEALGLLHHRINGLPQMRSVLLTELGLTLGACDRLDEAADAHTDALRAAAESYDGPIVAAALQGFGDLALRQGDPERAAYLLGSAHGQRGVPDRSSPELAANREAARAALGAERFEAAYARGRASSRAELLDQLGLGDVRPAGVRSAADTP
ncbi:BTAD domain-containing putative transcriptional regulator [Streptacidiphilus neutrinimicus]|uniref:BTAD domain-containing putative transcriptional regulator n=1 Tax=Streptacidiphilus neutrinimicus TaxID=105420 RepID=UPI0005A96EBD|nr:BTAD domain-containing putative transcriptional regulator [Streptacidiphilus neutrinimicus]